MTYHQPGAAGTASDRYRLPEPDHEYTPEPSEYGRRDVCAHCGREHAAERGRGR